MLREGSTLKYACIEARRGEFKVVLMCRAEIFEYIDVRYDRRRHSTLGYVSPAEFERNAA